MKVYPARLASQDFSCYCVSSAKQTIKTNNHWLILTAALKAGCCSTKKCVNMFWESSSLINFHSNSILTGCEPRDAQPTFLEQLHWNANTEDKTFRPQFNCWRYFRLSYLQIRYPTDFIWIASQECLCATIGGLSLDQVDISPKDPTVQYYKHLATLWWDLMGACWSSGQDQTTFRSKKISHFETSWKELHNWCATYWTSTGRVWPG